jgi:hypothetical protein
VCVFFLIIILNFFFNAWCLYALPSFSLFSNSLFPSLGGDFLSYPFILFLNLFFFFSFAQATQFLLLFFTFYFFCVDGEQGENNML